jgi:hypothetical protein
VRVGAPDPSLTAVSGTAAVTELVERLGVIEALDAAVGRSGQKRVARSLSVRASSLTRTMLSI